MNKRLMSVVGAALTLAAAVAGLSQGSGAAAQGSLQSNSFADPAFQRVWTRTDQLVAQGQAGRSWFWGPQPRTRHAGAVLEAAGRPAPGAVFRQEPHGDQRSQRRPEQPFYVTNGLLTVELISGNMQIGASAYSPRYPACINDRRRLGRPDRADLRQLPQRGQRRPRRGPHRPRQARPGGHRRPSTATATWARTPARAACPA